VSLLVVVLVFLAVVFVEQLGWLQFLEFKTYDFLIRQQPRAANSEPVVLVEMTEGDIHSPSLDYPIHDDKLAQLLRNLAAAQPAAIGLDIWRDIPVPKNGSGLARFNEVLQTHSNIVAIFTLAGIAAPAVLGSNPDRIAFNDNLLADVDVDHTVPKVRRTMLFAQKGGEGQTFEAFPLRLTLLYLAPRGIQIAADPADSNVIRLGKARLRAFQANDGAYVRADPGGWQILIDFKCPDQFTRFSFSQVLAGDIPPEKIRGKIVLIGMNAPSVSDEHPTPIYRNHRGVEVHAVIVNQLLRMALNGEPQLQFCANWMEKIWTLLWCGLGGLIGYCVRSPWRLGLMAGICLLGLAGVVWQAFVAGWWLPSITPALGFVPAAALVVSYVSFQERSMRNILMKLYSRHVSKEIAESTWANRDSFLEGGRPLAQKLVVTVLFTDLKGFSTISEKMEPARLYEWLNGYLGAMANVIQQNGGVLKQFTGDGILALFGVPLPHPTKEEQASDARKCVRCALAMGRRLMELNRDWQTEGLPKVSMRAGIFTGEVAAGSIGSDERFEYAVIGDVVNTASRLESYDKSFADPDLLPTRCRLLVGAPTHDLLGDDFLTKEIGLLEVKGKVNKVPVFQVLDEKSPAKP
jgi:adenylate cyclase